MKPIVKIVLFIGLFLLVIAVISYSYFTYKEGFQTTDLTTFCSDNENVCTQTCYNNSPNYNPNPVSGTGSSNRDPMNPDPYALAPETSDEMNLYDRYEYYNLQDINTGLPLQSTNMLPVDPASMLGTLDPMIPTPWDQDNIHLDPRFVLWGTIETSVSQALRDIAITRLTLGNGSANPAEFIKSNPTSAANTYRSSLFNVTVPNGPKAQGLQTLEAFVHMGAMVGTDMVAQSIYEWGSKASIDRHESILKAINQYGLQGDVNAYDNIVKAMDNMEVERIGKHANAIRDQEATRLFNEKAADGNYKYRNATGGLNDAGLKQIQQREKQFLRQALDNPPRALKPDTITDVKKALDVKPTSVEMLVKPNNFEKAMVVTADSVKAAKVSKLGLIGKVKSGIGRGIEYIFRPITRLFSHLSKGVVGRVLRSRAVLVAKKLCSKLMMALGPMTLLRALCSSLVAATVAQETVAKSQLSTGATLSSTVVTMPAGVTMTAAGTAQQSMAAATRQQSWVCWTVDMILEAFEVACFTFIPILLNQIHDPAISKCPATHSFSVDRAILKMPGGQIGWDILSGIPDLGALVTTFAPYVCWYSNDMNPDGTPGTFNFANFIVKPAVLIESIHPPIYYFDATLSIFTAEKAYAKVPDPNDPQAEEIASGISVADRAYYEPAYYRDNFNNYPIWVDYANYVMLDKMAQYYHDMSRAAAVVNIDGTATYEYISKFYGVISSSEYTCDVQCEISEITIDTNKGIKLCERIVDPIAGGSCTWHDRRFYWYVDITAGINLETTDSITCGNCFQKIQNLTHDGKPVVLSESDKCHAMLGTNTMYDVHGTPIPSNLTKAQIACTKMILMNNPPGNPRHGWPADVRMKDNMKKFFITGCTHVDGTAPNAADVSNQQAAGTPIGSSIIAVGPPNYLIDGQYVPTGEYYPPVIGEATTSLPQNSISVPIDTACGAKESSMINFGSTVSEAAVRLQDAAARVANPTQVGEISKSPFKNDWTVEITKNDGKNSKITSVVYDGTTKHLTTRWTGCADGDAGAACQIQQGYSEILYESLIAGAGAGKIGVPRMATLNEAIQFTGFIVSPIANSFMGISDYMKCLSKAATAQSGTFILNGMIVTSESSEEKVSFVTFQGPIMPLSPGYEPTIQYDAKIPSLNLMNCVNRYTVRYFVKTFQDLYPYKKLTRILNITPRRVIISQPADPATDNANPCCVFRVQDENVFGTAAFNTYALKMKLEGYRKGSNVSLPPTKKCPNGVSPSKKETDIYWKCATGVSSVANPSNGPINTYVYRPVHEITENIPPAVPFKTNAVDKTFIPSAPDYKADTLPSTVSSKLITPDPTCNSLDCEDFALQTHLFRQFNENHLGTMINLETLGSGASQKYAAVLKTYTPNSVINDNIQSCIYEVLLDHYTPTSDEYNMDVYKNIDVFASGSSGSSGSAVNVASTGPPLKNKTTFPKTVEMFLTPVKNPTRETLCVYELEYDSYPDNLWYKRVPLNFFDIPPPNIPINPNFSKQTEATNIPFVAPPASGQCLEEYTTCAGITSTSPSSGSTPARTYTPCCPPNYSCNSSGTGCTRIGTCYVDCSGAALMQNLVTQFNLAHDNVKINGITRAWTPALYPMNVNDSTKNPPVCDYDVEIVRTHPPLEKPPNPNSANSPVTIAARETVRFYLKPTKIPSCGDDLMDPSASGFDLDRDDSDKAQSGISLNASQSVGVLEKPFTWSQSFIRKINSSLNGYILNIFGLDGPNVIDAISKNALTTITTILQAAALTQTLAVCPIAPCKDPYVLQKILNRFNFNNYPKYPTEQYNSQKVSIVQFRRAGISSPVQCQVELIQDITTYPDLLYKPKNTKRNFLQKWAFDLIGPETNGCSFRVKDISGTDLTKNVMNVNANPYSLMSEYSVIDPALTTYLATNPTTRYVSNNVVNVIGDPSSKDLFTYEEPKVDCLAPSVLAKIQSIYNSINVATTKDSKMGRVPKYNTIVSILEYFNPVPNVCEYKAQVVHTYYDSDYGWYYTVPLNRKDKSPISSRDFTKQDYTYLVATWAANTDYEVESGILLQNSPSVVEYHFPDLKLINGNFYFPNGKGPVNLPYLSGVGNEESDVDTSEPRFTSGKNGATLYSFV